MDQAKRNALRDRYGEHRTSSAILACDSFTQKETGNDCDFLETTWVTLGSDGFISDIRLTDENVTEVRGAKICTVKADITIQDYRGKADRLFETEVKMHEKILVNKNGLKEIYKVSPTPDYSFKPRDKAVVKINSSIPSYHYVFYWAPQIDELNYYKIFPNHIDSQKRAKTAIQIPSNNRIQDWDIEFKPINIAYSTEFLIVVSTKDRFHNIPERVSASGFSQWLNQHPRERWTLVKYTYRIVGDSL
ncbi:MAG: hypothetical protein VXX88_06275 [Pseudomonadota bacterium]|nr:hypothetical protein [Pseudomonadota bacterium]